jgi:hypothetical protein
MLVLGVALAAALALLTSTAVLRGGTSAPHAGPRAAVASAHGGSYLSGGLLAAASVSIGASQHAFWPVHEGDQLLTRGGGLEGSFGASGARMRTDAGTLFLSAASIRRGSRSSTPRPLAPEGSRNEVLYRSRAITELYRNGPYGLEQAFTLPRRPLPGRGPLILSSHVGGTLTATQAGSEIVFSGARGVVALRYGELSALDARGRLLPAHMRLRGHALLLVIDDGHARYPLRIDPFMQQGTKLTGGGETGAAELGTSVALSANGNTAVVGAPADNSNVGAAWVFTRSGTTWEQFGGKLTGAEETGKGRFGFRVSLSSNGETALIGGPVDNANVGAAWVFTLSGGEWKQQGSKLTGGGENGKGEFGTGTALSADGNTAVIGGLGDTSGSGAAWVFTRSGEGTWEQQGSKLTGAGEVGEGRFGFSTALAADGNTALIGGGNDNAGVGAAWVFTRAEAGKWEQQGGKLTGSGEVGAGHVGFSVALSGDGNTALLGGVADNAEVGAAWVFTRSGAVWSQQGAKLKPTDETGKGLFGSGVALSGEEGNVALIGGSGDSSSTGAAWPFRRTGGTWEQLGLKLSGSGEVGKGQFGFAVVLSPDASTALVGGSADNAKAGAAWPFADVAEAPTVVTEPASAVTGSSATLNATVNPNAEEVTDCHFNWGTTIAYGSTAPCAKMPGSNASPVHVSAAIEGLVASTIYHFQIVATNATGTSEGADQTFATSNPPEFGRCLKVAKGVVGKFSNAGCSKPATAEKFSYEWAPGAGPKPGFTTSIQSATIATLETTGKRVISCKGEKSAGEYTSAKTVGTVVITFSGCEMSAAKCTSPSAAEGEVITTTLEGTLGVEKIGAKGPPTDKLALDLFPASEGTVVAEFSCGTAPVVVRGSVLDPFPANKMFLTATLKYGQSGGKQKPEKFAGGTPDVLSTSFEEGAPEQTGLQLTTVLTNAEKMEASSVV